VKNAVGTVAAAANDQLAGLRVTASARVRTRLAKEAGANAITASPGASSMTAAPTRRHDTGYFHPQRRTAEAVLDRLVRQQAHRIHHVAEIQARGAHLDFDFVLAERAS
jgi:hypothetical protein